MKEFDPIKFNLIVFVIMCIFFPPVDFIQTMLIKATLKQDQKEEVRSKAEKIIVQGNLNSSFVFLF